MNKKVLAHITLIAVLNMVAASVAAQVNVRSTINRDKILIGEPISLTVEAYIPLGTDVNWFQADSIASFEITDRSKIDTIENIDGKKIIQTLVVTSFDSGSQFIPPFEVVVNNQSFFTDSIPVEVSFTAFDANADYRDIKEIIEVVNPQVRYIPWVIAAVAVISLLGLILLLSIRKKSVVATKAPVMPMHTPYEEAMSALQLLQRKGVANEGVKSFYSELNDVLRRYLAREFNIATFERTNEELILQLSRLNLVRDTYLSLAQSLRMSDFVKFAKYTPADAENAKNLETVRSSIELLNKKVASAV